MFSVRQKREISGAIQILSWSWADIRNNGAVSNSSVNPHNEVMDTDDA